jgi:hypothetical protein
MCISASVNRTGGDVTLLTCSFCNEPIEIKPAKTDEYGHAVHEACYVLKMQKLQVGEPDGSNRRLQVLAWISTVPATAVCSACGELFTISVKQLTTAMARASLQRRFDDHAYKRNGS